MKETTLKKVNMKNQEATLKRIEQEVSKITIKPHGYSLEEMIKQLERCNSELKVKINRIALSEESQDIINKTFHKPYHETSKDVDMTSIVYPEDISTKEYIIQFLTLEQTCKDMMIEVYGLDEYVDYVISSCMSLLMEMVNIYVDFHYREQIGKVACQIIGELTAELILKSIRYEIEHEGVEERLKYYASLLDNETLEQVDFINIINECYNNIISL